MSEPTNEDDQPTDTTGTGTGSNESTEQSEPGVIGDEQLPEDLQPEKNPLARDPEEAARGDSDDGPDAGPPDAGGAPAQG